MSRPNHSHTPSRTASEHSVIAHAGRPRRAPPATSGAALSGSALLSTICAIAIPPSVHGCGGAGRGGVQRLPHVIARVGEFLGAARGAEVVARTRQRYIEDLLDASFAHDHDAVG